MQATLFAATLLDMLLFGMVAQQFYTYWITGFKDPTYLKLFVVVQFFLVAFQNSMIWYLVTKVFVIFEGQLPPGGSLWSGPANSLCQLFIVLLANSFLVFRIYGLTKSRTKSLVPIAFSIIAFVFGMVTVVATAWSSHSESFRYATSVVWYTSQATAECLITYFLVCALLKNRSGVHKSDLMVRYLARNVIQAGVLATIWALASLVSWFWLNHVLVYRLFDITSGSVYTHAIFETLISRIQLRGRMAASTFVDVECSTSDHVQWHLNFPTWPSLLVYRWTRSQIHQNGFMV